MPSRLAVIVIDAVDRIESPTSGARFSAGRLSIKMLG